MGVLTGDKFPYILFTLLLLTIIYSYYSVHKGARNIYNFFWISSDVARVGDFLEIGYKLNNSSFIPIPYIEAICNISKKLGGITFPKEIIFLKPFQLVSLRKRIECRHRGYYQLGQLEIVIRDFFHLFEKKIVFNKNLELIVYPRVYEISRIPLLATEFYGALRVPYNTHEDYTRVRNIRNYVEGDNVKKIHWKLSAKTKDLLVRDFELSANTKLNIYIDGFKGYFDFDEYQKEDLEEKMIEVAASIIKYSLKNNFLVSLTMTGKDKSTIDGRGLDKLEDFLKELIGFSTNGSIELSEILIHEGRKLTYGSTLIIITTKINRKIFETLVLLRKKGFNMMFILASKDNSIENEDKMMDYLNNIQIDAYRLSLDSYIPKVLEGYR